MKRDYTHISTEELLQDDFFISSIINPTEETQIFWERRLADGNIDPEVFREARNILLSLNRAPHRTDVPEERIEKLWERIEDSVNGVRPASRRTPAAKRWMWPAALVASAACIAVAIILRPLTGPDNGTTTINGTDVRTLAHTEDTNYIKLVLGEKVVEIPGDEARVDYSRNGLTINEQEIAGQDREQGKLNLLAVPYGKRSTLILADSSRLWINAGTKVIYPEKFAGDRREIYVDGEVYGEIAHNLAWPFVIKTKRAGIEVLGTTLNVNAYEKEEELSVVLVGGKVAVTNAKGRKSELAPNQMYFSSGEHDYITAVDVEEYVSWKDGNYKFRNEKIATIVKRLSKYYNINIVADLSTSGLTCSGELILKDELIRVLDVICNTAQIQYTWDSEKRTYMLHR